MDKQEDESRKQMQGTGVSVIRRGDPIALNTPSNITFSTGSADLSASFLKVLDAVALVPKKYDKTIVEVDGHTDGVGKPDYNQNLSERRACAVAKDLIGKGIKQERTTTVALERCIRWRATTTTRVGR